MADEPENTTPVVVPTPHKEGLFFRLMSMFGLTQHPTARDFETIADDEGAASNWWNKMFQLARDRKERYRIFDEMDSFGIIEGILDLYAEEVTQPDYDKQRTIWIESKSKDIISVGDECLRNIRIEDTAFPLIREACKYGDSFRRLIYASEKGVLGWQHVAPTRVDRVQDKFARLVGFKESGQKYRQKMRDVSWPWDYVHFRLLGKDEHTMYGSSLIEPVFRAWRQLTLSEDAVLLYRLRRAPDRNVVFVDVGNMEEHDAINYLNQWRKRFRKHEFIDPASSEYKKQYNPLTPIEDIFFPVRGDTGHSRIENLSGAANAGDIADLEHFRNALFGAARVPKAYMGFEGEINAKATLSQQDVRFARGCKRVRRTLLYGLRTTLDVHFALHSGADAKFDVEREGNEYVVQSSPISYLDEWERLELVQLRYQIVDAMSTLAANLQLDVKAWATYILTDYAKLPDSMVAKLMSKTAPEKAESDGLSSRERKQILETHGMAGLKAVTSDMGPKGYVQLSEDEKRAIGRAIHRHAGLRKVISDLVEYHADDFEDMSIREAQLRQRDSALLPPTVLGKLMDDVADDQSATQLQEDLKAIRTQTPLNERKGDNHASTDATVERKA